jgi:DNA polymerase-3 subunit alpha
VTSVQHRVAKASGNQYGMIQVEDFGGEITVMFMGKAYQEYSAQLQGDAIVVVRGRVSLRDDGMNLHAFSLMTPDLGQANDSGPLTVALPNKRATPDLIEKLDELFHRHEGETEVKLGLIEGSVMRAYDLPKHRVAVTPDLYGELKGLLGPHCLV